MDVSKLKRNAKSVLKYIKQDGDRLIATAPMEIHILKALENKNLIVLKGKKEILGSFAVVAGDEYLVWSAATMYEIKSNTSRVEVINGQSYRVFSVEKGDVLINSLTTLKTSTLVYDVVALYLLQGKVPWFYGTGDVTRFLSTCKKYAGLSIDDTPEILEMFEAIMTRLDTDTDVFLKNAPLTPEERASRGVFIPLKNVNYMRSPMGKVLGNYQAEGMRSALMSPSTEPGIVEKITRS